MKKVLVRTILIFLMTASIIACSKDEETTAPISIVGKWGLVYIKEKTTQNGQITLDTTMPASSNDYILLELYSDGTGLSARTNKNYLFKYMVSGTTFYEISYNTKDTTVYNNTNVTATTLKLGYIDTIVINGRALVFDNSYIFEKIQ
jgi:hypothetical protein